MKLKGKIALITGGAQGLGKAIALAMANEGANIVIGDINPKTFPEVKAEIESTGVRCLAGKCDVSSVESVADLFRETVATFGTLDILVNNAGAGADRREEEMRSKFYKMMTTPVAKESLGVTKDFPDEEWHKYWGVNVHGVFYCTREALRIMEPKKSGKIINIASIAGMAGLSAFNPAYCATKGAVLAFTRSVAIEVAGANIFVNAIAAGGILTPPMEAFLASASEAERNSLHQIDSARPLGQAGGVRLARRLPCLRRALPGWPDHQSQRRHGGLSARKK